MIIMREARGRVAHRKRLGRRQHPYTQALLEAVKLDFHTTEKTG